MAMHPAKLSGTITVSVARNRTELAAHVPAWDALSKEALDPNIFYESAMVLATLDNLGVGSMFCFAMVYRGAEMIGFFPFWPSSKGPRGILKAYRSFEHINCYLTTPLVHQAHAVEAVDALLDWLDRAPGGARILGFYKIAGDTAFAGVLVDRLHARRQPSFVEGGYERAFFQPAETADAYLERAISTKKRKEYRRQRRRLEEQGKVTITTITGEDGADQWVMDFVDMERRGWKGQGRAAFATMHGGVQYLRAVVEKLARQGRVALHTMALDGKPIAMKCNFVGAGGPPSGSFAYKIAYDESLARFSPGVLLELHNIEYLHSRQDEAAWMDSCADPHHPMIDHLWDDRRQIVYLTCASRSLLGRGIIAALKRRNVTVNKRLAHMGQGQS